MVPVPPENLSVRTSVLEKSEKQFQNSKGRVNSSGVELTWSSDSCESVSIGGFVGNTGFAFGDNSGRQTSEVDSPRKLATATINGKCQERLAGMPENGVAKQGLALEKGHVREILDT